MAIFVKGNNGLSSRLKSLLKLQRLNHTFTEKGLPTEICDPSSDALQEITHIDISTWKKIDARFIGINSSMIPAASWTVLQVLRNKGFEAYLVGGCVRDLILNRIPKDFDVITTAGLKQIKMQFHRAQIVGQRFPICMVYLRGSTVEVASFETTAKNEKQMDPISHIPKGCDKTDIMRWRNSMHRDFTINSLFFDPFVNTIYDYVNGIRDLRSMKLRTLVPAQMSFKADCARILRGIRVAARLGLSFSKDTETAIHNLSSSVMGLAKCRLMMEMNYMLSYGAAEPSLNLLRRFKLLEILLPFHAAYLDKQAAKKSPQMLMRLFFNLDIVVSCERPSDCNLWVGLLAFHQALVNNPQDALVILAFASVLYHGEWREGVRFAREHAQVHVNFVPEIRRCSESKSDEELAEGVAYFASLVQGSIAALTEIDHPSEPSSLVFISNRTAKNVAQVFKVLVNDVESYQKGRTSFEIDYRLLGKGMVGETRFVLGEVILETMSSGIVHEKGKVLEEQKKHDHPKNPKSSYHVPLSDTMKQHLVAEKDRKHCLEQEMAKKELIQKLCNVCDQEMVEKGEYVQIHKKESLVKMFQLNQGETNIVHDAKIVKKQRALRNEKSQSRSKMKSKAHDTGVVIKKKRETVRNYRRQSRSKENLKALEKDRLQASPSQNRKRKPEGMKNEISQEEMSGQKRNWRSKKAVQIASRRK